MFRPNRSRSGAALCVWACVLGLISTSSAAEPLLDNLPGDSTNAIAVARIGEILKANSASVSGDRVPLPGGEHIPTWIERLVVGSHVRPGSRERVQTIAIAALQPGTKSGDVVASRGGSMGDLGGFQVSETARGDYLVALSDRTVALVRPGVRQEVARWLGSLNSKDRSLSPFLKQAAEMRHHLVFAIDLRGAVSSDRVARWIESKPAGELGSADPGQVSSLLTRLVGVSLGVDVGRESAAVVRVRFDGPVSADPAGLQKVFNSILRDAHASLPELESARAAIEGSELVLRAPLSEDGLRRIVSLLTSPTKAESEPAATAERSADAQASQRYFTSVDRVFRDLERANRRATDYARTAVWHDNFAQKIEELSTTGVDPALVEFGLQTASRLRALAASLRGQGLKINAEQRTVTYDVHVDPGYFGYDLWGGVGYKPSAYNVSSNVQQVRERQATAVTAGAEERTQIWQMLADDRAAISSAMTEKYGVPFGEARR